MKNDRYNNFVNQQLDGPLDVMTSEVLELINSKSYKTDGEREYIRQYCLQAINEISYTDEEQQIYFYYLNNILRHADFEGKIAEDDVRVVTQYLALKKIKDLGLRTHFEIVPDYLYTLKYGFMSGSSCRTFSDGHSIIYLRNSLFKRALLKEHSINQQQLFTLLELVYHEIAHAEQNDIMCKQLSSKIEDKNVLIWIKENLIEDYDPDYYTKNYKNMFFERDAHVKGCFTAIDTCRTYFKIFNPSFLDKVEKATVEYYHDTRGIKHLDPQTNYKSEEDAVFVIDNLIDKIAHEYPDYIHERLGLQYDKAGVRYSSRELSDNYYKEKALIVSECGGDEEICKKRLEKLNDLYNHLIWSAKEIEMYARAEELNAKVKKIK